jgi:hypothetical protein
VKLASLGLSLCAVAACLSFGSRAVAETDASSRALAVQLFDDAEKLFAGGQVSAACPKYAESYRLDPQLGVLIYLAECFEKDGKLASAWGSYREAVEIAQKRGDQRAGHAAERAKAIEPRLSYLQIDVPAAARVNGLELTRDGAAVAPVLWGARAAIDAGTHRIEAHAPGYQSWHADVTIAKEASAETVKIPMLVVDASKGGSTAAAGAGGVLPGTSQRIAALAVGGLGLAAVGVGGFFGLSAQSSYSDSKDFCNDANFCTPRGNDLRSEAKNKATIATVASGVGLAAVVTAGVLWFTAPRSDNASSRGRAERRYAFSVAPASSRWGLEVNGAF